jgi:hypothetical protein
MGHLKITIITPHQYLYGRIKQHKKYGRREKKAAQEKLKRDVLKQMYFNQ